MSGIQKSAVVSAMSNCLASWREKSMCEKTWAVLSLGGAVTMVTLLIFWRLAVNHVDQAHQSRPACFPPDGNGLHCQVSQNSSSCSPEFCQTVAREVSQSDPLGYAMMASIVGTFASVFVLLNFRRQKFTTGRINTQMLDSETGGHYVEI